MTIELIHGTVNVEVQDFRSLMAAWEQYSLAGRYTIRRRLTASERKQIPAELRTRLG